MQRTCDLYDVFKDTARYFLPVFRDFGGRLAFSGEVVTVKCHEDNSRLKDLSTTPGKGKVLVVDGGGSLRCALMGDVIAADFAANGWEGLVIHGCIRDMTALAALDLGIKALASNARASTRRSEGTVGISISLPGAECRPGDILTADEDGVVLLEPSQAQTA